MLQIFQTNALGVAVPQMGIAKIEIKKLTNKAGVKSNGQITHYAPIKDVLAGKKAVSEADQADMPDLEFGKNGFIKPDNVKQIQQIHKEEARLKQKGRKLAKERGWNWQYQTHMNGEPTFTYLHTWKELVKKADFYGYIEKQYKKLKREYGADFDDNVKYMKENGGQKAGFTDLGDIELYEKFKADHKQAIAEALKRGVDVPKAVLKEYPEFASAKPKTDHYADSFTPDEMEFFMGKKVSSPREMDEFKNLLDLGQSKFPLSGLRDIYASGDLKLIAKWKGEFPLIAKDFVSRGYDLNQVRYTQLMEDLDLLKPKKRKALKV